MVVVPNPTQHLNSIKVVVMIVNLVIIIVIIVISAAVISTIVSIRSVIDILYVNGAIFWVIQGYKVRSYSIFQDRSA